MVTPARDEVDIVATYPAVGHAIYRGGAASEVFRVALGGLAEVS
jgi:hypothetical protein